MDTLKNFFQPRKVAGREEYEPLTEEPLALAGSEVLDGSDEVPFSWVEYSIFALIGVAMLWAWNMFLAAAPYFQTRFQDDDWILANFQSTIISVSTVINLIAVLLFTKIQHSANYPLRINTALAMNIGVFALLTLSCLVDASPKGYLAFLLVMVAFAAWAAGLLQNGAFAFAAGFGRSEYTQAIMAGQGIAGVLPPVAQMVSVLVVPDSDPNAEASGGGGGGDGVDGVDGVDGGDDGLGRAALIYFLTAVAVSVCTLLAFVPLVRRHNRVVQNRSADSMAASTTSVHDAEVAARKIVGMRTLFRKLHWLAGSVFMCFVASMFFPVFTAQILSVRPADEAPRVLQPSAFIPLGFFFWNAGDLTGRMSTISPFSLRHRPGALFTISIARIAFLPLYLLCNINGRGAVVNSDLFYLILVQFLFGLTNGWLASNSMMAAGEWVEEGEREAAGSFMGLCLVAGLTVGSLLSFTAAGI